MAMTEYYISKVTRGEVTSYKVVSTEEVLENMLFNDLPQTLKSLGEIFDKHCRWEKDERKRELYSALVETLEELYTKERY